jgi:hypothetical protein
LRNSVSLDSSASKRPARSKFAGHVDARFGSPETWNPISRKLS